MINSILESHHRDRCRAIGAEQNAVNRIETKQVQELLRAGIERAAKRVFQLPAADTMSEADVGDAERLAQSVAYPRLRATCKTGAITQRIG